MPGTNKLSWMIGLVIVALVNSAVAAAYYLRVIAACLLYENERPATTAPRELLRMGAAACGFLLLIFTFFPAILLKAGRDATRDYRDGFVAAGTDAAPSRVKSRGPKATGDSRYRGCQIHPDFSPADRQERRPGARRNGRGHRRIDGGG